MHVLRYVCSGLLLLFASVVTLTLTLAEVAHVEHAPAPKYLIFFFYLLIALVALLSVLTALYLLRPQAHWESRLSCPRCQRSGVLARSTLRQPHVSLWWLLAGGFIGSLLFTHARKHGFICHACQAGVNLRTLGGKIALAWLVVFVLVLAIAIFDGGR